MIGLKTPFIFFTEVGVLEKGVGRPIELKFFRQPPDGALGGYLFDIKNIVSLIFGRSHKYSSVQ